MNAQIRPQSVSSQLLIVTSVSQGKGLGADEVQRSRFKMKNIAMDTGC